MNLGNIFNNFINNIAYLERIFGETIDELGYRKRWKHAEQDAPKIRWGKLRLTMAFAYDGNKTIKRRILTVNPGRVLLHPRPEPVERNTIVNLISRFYNVNGRKGTDR